ncbi:MAG: hypothetical protein IKH57_27270 [Clostridia bacterium]|nr:hypothetical protein [Lachnospiraceae bacterium]MBR3020726.1 hypothetical protein [Clostridia bacterium]
MKWIVEQADNVFNTIAPPDSDAEEEETHYRVTDNEGNVIGGCTLETKRAYHVLHGEPI